MKVPMRLKSKKNTYKSSVMSSNTGDFCDCAACDFLKGNYSPENMLHVIRLLDSKLYEAEKLSTNLTRALMAKQ